MDFLRTKATQKLQRSLDMARKCHQSSVCQQTSDWILLEGFTVVPAGSSSFSTTTQLRLHHGEKKMCSTSPVIAALPYLPIWMDAICQQPPRSRNPPSCDINGFLAGVVSNSKIVTIHTCYRKCIIKDHKGPEKLKTLRQVCPLMVTSAFKGVSHGCNQWPQRPSFVPNDNISRPLLGEQVELQAVQILQCFTSSKWGWIKT